MILYEQLTWMMLVVVAFDLWAVGTNHQKWNVPVDQLGRGLAIQHR